MTTKDLKVNSKYEMVISKDIASAKGEKLGKDTTIEFSTSGGGGGLTYVLLMVAMVAVMGFMTIKDQHKRLKEESEGNEALKIETNPYKLAKERNISVVEANSLINTEREKLRGPHRCQADTRPSTR